MKGLDIIEQRHDAASDKTLSSIREESRVDMTYSYQDHPKGQWFQFYLKKLIEKTLLWMHTQIENHYDKNAFVFDDERLKEIRVFANDYCETNFVDKVKGVSPTPRRKAIFIMAAVDIFLFFLKEDVFYRARVLDSIDKFVETKRGKYLFTEIEQQNLKDW